MPILAHRTWALRRALRASHGLLLAGAFAAALLAGVFSRVGGDALPLQAALGLGWVLLFASRAIWRARLPAGHAEAGRLELELGLWALLGAYAIVQRFGGPMGALHPLTYAVLACVVALGRRPAAPVFVACALALELASYAVAEGGIARGPLAAHIGFVALFGAMSFALTRAEIARIRLGARQRLARERARAARETRMFRLVAGASGPPASDERRHGASVDEVHHTLYRLLHVLRQALALDTALVLMRDDQGLLRIVELATDRDDVAEGPFRPGEGAVGAVLRNGTTRLEHVRPGYTGLCYYRGPTNVCSFVGVPLEEGGQVVGVLCADRHVDTPFAPGEVDTLALCAEHFIHVLQNERVFLQLERSKQEQSILYGASQALGAALTKSDAIDAALDAARQIAAYDFAAITTYDGTSRKHAVGRAVGEDAARFEGLVFRDNASLTAMAVKNRHYLPYRGDFDPDQQTLFTRRANVRDMASMLVLPLVVREDALGTLILAARRRHAFGDRVRPTLQVLANQLAVSLANAAAVERLEQLATTDGLTGCLNKRTFLEELERKIRAAERFGRQLSLIVTDIDHFKRVNDTYGHAVGDVVIRELGKILREIKRETDLVARFGGEEFCVLCEETDTAGAVQLAERVRERLGATVFQTDAGPLTVEASLGVAAFPDHARTGAALFEAADKALYDAKHRGRNQVRAA
ncbi:MAG: diguanylate cyclase [Myxococcales bacterium]|nr:diguanylate cyclase [Myxococcales bacterium]